MFAKYHYLNHKHHQAAKCFICLVNGTLAGFISILHFPHPHVKNIKRVHRLVVLPDFQGIGIGIRLLNVLAKIYVEQKFRFHLITSNPALIFALKKQDEWKLRTKQRFTYKNPEALKCLVDAVSNTRITTSWEYSKQA